MIREEVLRLYAETDHSYAEIAEELSIQWRTVEYIIRNFASECNKQILNHQILVKFNHQFKNNCFLGLRCVP